MKGKRSSITYDYNSPMIHIATQRFLLVAALLSIISCTSPQHETGNASIGASIGVDKNGWLYLIDLIEDGPAANSKAILHGDRLVAIQASPDTEMVYVHTIGKQEVLNLIRGKKGSSITLRLLRNLKTEYVTLNRDYINRPNSASASKTN